jgi:hypothetical protein
MGLLVGIIGCPRRAALSLLFGYGLLDEIETTLE